MNSSTTKYVIVFDFGGVLIDWNPRYLYRKLFADENAMEQFFDDVQFLEWNAAQDRRRSFAEGVAEHSQKFPHHAELIRAYDERWTESVGGEIAETVEILRALKAANYPVYGLSNWSPDTFARIRSQFPFLNWLDGILLSGDVELTKPDPRIFQILLTRVGRPANECIFIDDAEKNITAAQALGFHTIHYTSAEQTASELRALGIQI